MNKIFPNMNKIISIIIGWLSIFKNEWMCYSYCVLELWLINTHYLQVQRASSLPLHIRGNEKNNESGLLPSIIFRFEERGNPKYNLPSKFLGEVHVRVFLKTHAGFVRQLTGYCRKVKELTRKIAKVLFRLKLLK